jgi:HEAT repeat protein
MNLGLRSSWPWEVFYQSSRANWRFDLVSFAIGCVVALLLVGLIYRYRIQLAHYWGQIKNKADQARQRLTANTAARYSVSAIETAQSMHLLGALASLDQIYVETQLYAPLATNVNEAGSVSLSPRQATQASNRLVIIGQPGSGRTTLLNHLLLLQASRFHAAGTDQRVPVYIYLPALTPGLPDIVADERAGGKDGALAEHLAQAAIASMPRLSAAGVIGWLCNQVKAGNALVLLDGWDEVPAAEQPTVTTWIEKLILTYPNNHLVVSAGERGYAPLIEAGCVPLRPVPWTRRQLADLTQRWMAAWPAGNDGPPAFSPQIPHRLTAPTPLQATVEMAIQLRGQRPARTPAGQMAQLIDLLLPAPESDDKGQTAWPLATGQRALGRLALAALEQDQPMLEREAIQSTVTEAMPPPQFIPGEGQDTALSREESKKAREEQDQRTLQVVDCCRALTADGAPIRKWGDRRYLFLHPVIAAYLAARHLAAEANTDNVSTVLAHADDAKWFDVLRFYVGLTPPEPLIQHLLSVPDDLFLSRLWTAAALLGAAPAGQAPWRNGLMARLGQLVMKDGWPTLLRNRALAALVQSGEAGVGLLFKRAFDLPDPHLRAGAILGLGALGHEQDIELLKTALGDDEPEVRLAAIEALGRLGLRGSEPAVESIVAAMVEMEAEAQRVAAEILAELGAEGHAVLREGARDQDLMVRRAAIYGLAVSGQPWAAEILQELQKDDQWLVRNAAVDALASLEADEQTTLPELALPQAETEPWLIKWAAERGEGTGVGEAAKATLMRALNEGELAIREAAIETLRRLADPRSVGVLRQFLRDPEPIIREAALSALEEISQRHNMTITLK